MNFTKFAKTALIASSVLVSSISFAANIEMNADENDLAISGYDTVAYFTKGKAIAGNVRYTATFNNAIYQFSSQENRDLFKAEPVKYAPQFGGYCAMGVAMERKFDVDPTAFKIVDNKLYLNLNSAVQQKWLTDVDGYIDTADGNWGDIKSKTAVQLED